MYDRLRPDLISVCQPALLERGEIIIALSWQTIGNIIPRTKKPRYFIFLCASDLTTANAKAQD